MITQKLLHKELKYIMADGRTLGDAFDKLMEPPSEEEKQTRSNVGSMFVKGFKNANNTKSLAGMAAKNTFEFPVFVSKSVPLDYATATNSLLEQLYASYLQMAISLDPLVDKDVAMSKAGPFAKYKTNITQYVEFTDDFYMHDACHNEITLEDGSVCEFNMISITDKEAEIINEAVNYQPLSEFSHYFQEADNDDSPSDDELMNGPFTADDMKSTKTTTGDKTNNSNTKTTQRNDSSSERSSHESNRSHSSNNSAGTGGTSGGRSGGDTRGSKDIKGTEESRSNSRTVSNQTGNESSTSKTVDEPSVADVTTANVDINTKLKEYRIKEQQLIEAQHRVERLEKSDQKEDAQIEQAKAQAEKARLECSKLMTELSKMCRDEHGRTYSYLGELCEKRRKLLLDRQISAKQLIQMTQDELRDPERWKMERERHNKDMMLRSAQYMDESKIQKLNTMKPLMLTVQLRLVSKETGVSEPVEYVIGVKTHNRLVDPDILPEVAAYPLKEMNKLTRQAKWRAKEIKFFDYIFKRKEKKQTAIDSKDPRRKWYRRLYELAHKKGDSIVSGMISGNHTTGLIPNATIIMSQSDVDNIKSQKDINLLKGSTAKKFCNELFLMSLIIIDLDSESIKILQPDTNNDFAVHSLASVKKQIATLDTAGDKTRDMFKLLGR
jgi:hypothetical protein